MHTCMHTCTHAFMDKYIPDKYIPVKIHSHIYIYIYIHILYSHILGCSISHILGKVHSLGDGCYTRSHKQKAEEETADNLSLAA